MLNIRARLCLINGINGGVPTMGVRRQRRGARRSRGRLEQNDSNLNSCQLSVCGKERSDHA